MIDSILGSGMPGPYEWIIILIISLFNYILPICLFVWLIKSILRGNKERQKTRIEIAKIADELEKIRKQGG